MHKIEHKEGAPLLECNNVHSCVKLIHELEVNADHPQGIFIYNEIGECMSVVIGGTTTAFVYYPVNYSGTGTFSSKAKTPEISELGFWLCGHYTEATRESQLPRSVLDSVVKDFLLNGGKSAAIEWEGD